MKIDCSKTENYFIEKSRMTNGCQYPCTTCPLSYKNNGKKVSCSKLQDDFTKEAMEIVQKWSDEHERKTILEDFLEKYPNVKLKK